MYATRITVGVCLLIGVTSVADPEEEVPHPEQADWDYGPDNGPPVWGRLRPEYAPCAFGDRQSPIDIVDPTRTTLPALAVNYHPMVLSVPSDGHTVEVRYTGENWVEVGDTRYELFQFHFHTPSEHTLDGRHFDMEIHFVHRSPRDTLAVVGVWVRRGREHPGVDVLAERLPVVPGQTQQSPGLYVNPAELLPQVRQAVRYEGSLTTPPCSQGVKWFVFTTPVEVSDTQLAAFEAVLGKNNRPVQPLNDRELLIGMGPLAQP